MYTTGYRVMVSRSIRTCFHKYEILFSSSCFGASASRLQVMSSVSCSDSHWQGVARILRVLSLRYQRFLTFIPSETVAEQRLCGLVVTVPGCRPRGPEFDFRHYQIFCVAVGLERGPLSRVRINEELLE
jgi:hypothetical protein